MIWFWLGLVAGVLITVPAGIWLSRRSLRRMLELEKLGQTHQRLAEMGAMTGGLAHEIKNPLSSINLNVQLLQEDLGELDQQLAREHNPDAAREHPHRERIMRIVRRLRSLGDEVTRLRDTLEDFLQFAGRIKLHRAPTDVNVLVDELADFFTPQAEQAGLHLRTQLAASPAVIDIDAGMIKQALLNLMINAAKATEAARRRDQPHGGGDELIIRTERKTLMQPQGPRRKPLPIEAILIHVIDTGPGIAHELHQKIFEPYYSTSRGGSGLGLPTSRRIVEEHGGQLTLHSEPGRGSDFTITLPVQPVPTETIPPPA